MSAARPTGGARDETLLCDGCDRAFHMRCVGVEAMEQTDAWRCEGCGGAVAAAGGAACAQESVLRPPLLMGGEVLPWATSGKYIGQTVHEDCGLDAEVAKRVQAARVAFHKMRALVLGGRATQHMKGVYRRCFEALTLSVMLYGAETWALSAAQLERLEVAQRGMLRAALPVRMRRRRGVEDAMSNAQLRRFYGLPKVGTLLERMQVRWLGHLAREPGERLTVQLLTAQRRELGRGAAGCRRPTLLGSYGTDGVYPTLLGTHLTSAARREFFDGSRAEWHVLAHNKVKWRSFVRSITTVQYLETN